MRSNRSVPDFEYCLRCGQPLTSWLSRRQGFGLQCWEALSRAERHQLVQAARALQGDLDLLDRAAERPRLRDRLRLLSIGIRDHD
jgi:hypothetical protein